MRQNRFTARTGSLIGLLFLFSYSDIWSQEASDVLTQSGIKSGLVVHIGATDGKLELDLANTGTFLVHGLSENVEKRDISRKAIFAEAMYGLASVELLPESDMLPYADNLVNLVVADLTNPAFSTVSHEEIDRILAPGGVSYLKEGDSWAASPPKPFPAEMGEWRQFRYDGTNNPVSPDRLVRPATTLQWLDDYSKGVHMSTAGIILAGDGAVAYYNRLNFNPVDRDLNDRYYTVYLRNAFNGIPRWNRVVGIDSPMRNSVIMGDKKVIVNLYREKNYDPNEETDGHARVLDIETGQTVRVLTNDLSDFENFKKDRDLGLSNSESMLVLHDNVLFKAAGKHFIAINVVNNERLWTYEADSVALYPAVSVDGEYVFIAEGTRNLHFSRWPSGVVNAITCLNAQTGEKVWRNTEVNGMAITYLVYHDGKVLFHGATGIGTYSHNRGLEGDPYVTVGVINEQGNIEWTSDFADAKSSVQGSFIRDGNVYLNNSKQLLAYDFLTGGSPESINTRVFNQRCERVTATLNYALMGFGTLLTPEGRYVDQNISRSGCASGVIPAYGMTYRANNSCWCFAQIRGFSAMSSEPMRTPVPDEKRLVAGNEYKENWNTVAFPQRVVNPMDEGGFRIPVYSGNVVRQSWFNNSDLPYPRTESVESQGITVETIVNEHLLEARSGGDVLWRFVTGGRMSIPPIVDGNRVIAGVHDGWIYCLDLQNGELLWKYLAAPSHRWIVAYGQIESAWPVMGLVVHNGEVNFTAGRHPEVDYGISLGGLNPETGEQIWRGAVYKPTATTWRELGDDSFERHVNLIQNPFLKSEGDKLIMVSGEKVAAGEPKGSERTFEVDPETIKPVAVDGPAKKQSHLAPRMRMDRYGITINFPEGRGTGSKISVMNALGREIHFVTVQSGDKAFLSLSHLKPGTYLVRVAGKEIHTAKFTKLK